MYWTLVEDFLTTKLIIIHLWRTDCQNVFRHNFIIILLQFMFLATIFVWRTARTFSDTNFIISLLTKFKWFLPPISLKISSLHMIWKPLNQFCCSLLSDKCFESLLSSGTSEFRCWQSLDDFYHQFPWKFRPCTLPESLWTNFVVHFSLTSVLRLFYHQKHQNYVVDKV